MIDDIRDTSERLANDVVRLTKQVTDLSDESLGISVAGGVRNIQKTDTPIYISNIQSSGCLGRSKQVQVRLACYIYRTFKCCFMVRYNKCTTLFYRKWILQKIKKT